MKEGDVITATIQSICFRQIERKQMGTTFGTYDSYYVAKLSGYKDAIVIIDSLVQNMHPDWEKKTSNRAEILTCELGGTAVKVRVVEIIREGIFEADLV